MAVVIMAVSLTLIIQSMTSALRTIQYSGDFTTALLILENKMFELLYRGDIEAGKEESGSILTGGRTYTFNLTTRFLTDSIHQGLNDVEVSLLWNSGKRKNKILLETYLFNPAE